MSNLSIASHQPVETGKQVAPAKPPCPTAVALAAGQIGAKVAADALNGASAIGAAQTVATIPQTSHHDGALFASDGEPIPFRVTVPSGPVKAVAVMQMGTLGKPEYFDQMAGKLADAGILCYAVGSRSSAPTYHQHANDLDAVVRLAKHEHPGTPLRVMGVSLGAMIALDWSATHNPDHTPVAAMAPVVVPTFLKAKDMGRIAAGLVCKGAAAKAVNTPMTAGKALTTNPDSPEAHLANPQAMHVPAALFDDVTKMTAETIVHGHAMKGRLLVAIAGDDEVSSAAAAKAFAKTIRSKDKHVETFPGLAHDMSQESQDPAFVGALTNWLLQK